jgi:hypothetical protein
LLRVGGEGNVEESSACVLCYMNLPCLVISIWTCASCYLAVWHYVWCYLGRLCPNIWSSCLIYDLVFQYDACDICQFLSMTFVVFTCYSDCVPIWCLWYMSVFDACDIWSSWHFRSGFIMIFECQACGATGSGAAEKAAAPLRVAWQACGATASGAAEKAAAPVLVAWQRRHCQWRGREGCGATQSGVASLEVENHAQTYAKNYAKADTKPAIGAGTSYSLYFTWPLNLS